MTTIKIHIVNSINTVFFQCYLLDALFEKTKVEVLGTTFEVRNGCIKGICQHPFDKEKVETLKKYGVDAIDDMYFDSSHDECLIGMSKG